MAASAIAGSNGGNGVADAHVCSEIRVVLRDELQRQLAQYRDIMEQLLDDATRADAKAQSPNHTHFIDNVAFPMRFSAATRPTVQSDRLPPTCVAPVAARTTRPQSQVPAQALATMPTGLKRGSKGFFRRLSLPSVLEATYMRSSHQSLNTEDRARREAAENARSIGGEAGDDFVYKGPIHTPSSIFRRESSLQGGSMFHQIVASHHFELIFAVAIVSNSVWVGFTVEYTTMNPSTPAPLSFYVVSHTFAYVFLVELLLRLLSEGCRMFCNDEWYWNCLDVIIVATSMCEVVFDMIFLTMDSSVDGLENISSVRIVRIIRITRLIRIFRITRIVRFIRALRMLVYAILCTLKSLIWAMLLLMLIVYVFAILFTQATSDYLVGAGIYVDALPSEWAPADEVVAMQRYWGSLPLSMFTLFKAIAGGLSWQEAVDCLEYTGHTMVMIFIFFIAFTYFAVLNVVTGVFCQSAIESTQHDQQMVVQNVLTNKKQYAERIKELFNCIDVNNDGCITLQEFEMHLEDDRVAAYFDALELEVTDAWTLFKLLDQDQNNRINIEDFVMGCVCLKGNARGIDMAKLSHENQWLRKRVTFFMEETEMHFQAVGAMLDRFDRAWQAGAHSQRDVSLTTQTPDVANVMERIESHDKPEVHTHRSAWSAEDPLHTGLHKSRL